MSWLAAAGLAYANRPAALAWRFAMPGPEATRRAQSLPPQFTEIFDYRKTGGIAHSPSLFETTDGKLIAYWFDGSREGAPDVVILSQTLLNNGKPAKRENNTQLASATAVETALLPDQDVRKLGNSLVAQSTAGAPLFLTTTVSIGGWAMAKIAVTPLRGDGTIFAPARHLPLSPVLNRSHLLRAPPVAYSDGSLGLPVYFEQLANFGELIRLAPNGRVLGKARMSSGLAAIQPVIVPLDANRAVAYFRNATTRDYLWKTRTSDGGRTWDNVRRTALQSMNSPAAALRLGSGLLAIVYNDSKVRRDRLVLAVSSDEGQTYTTIKVLEDGKRRPGEARYPYMIGLRDGSYALTYSTASKTGIRVLQFTQAWAKQKLAEARATQTSGPTPDGSPPDGPTPLDGQTPDDQTLVREAIP